MTRASTPKLAAYAALSAMGLLGALATGRPELVAVTAPFVLALAAGLALAASPPRLHASVSIERDRVVEGDDVEARVAVAAETTIPRAEVHLLLPPGVETRDGRNPVALALRAGGERELALTLHAARYGGHVLGPVLVRVHDPLGLVSCETAIPIRLPLRAYPREEPLRRALAPFRTQVLTGNEVARTKAEGIEFADLRIWSAGDARRRINWRASARRGDLWVNESHPERNTDVILFVDSFAEARRGGVGTLDLAVRATAALADAYVRRRDRVGLISFGGILRWLVPGSGAVQLYKIVDALIDTQVLLSYYWKEIDAIPRQTLPPNALVIGLSPLLDPRTVGALLDLRARGFDLALLEVSPLAFAERPEHSLDALAFDIWELRRDALRARLRGAGVAVAEWDGSSPLQGALEEVRSFRRYARHARA